MIYVQIAAFWGNHILSWMLSLQITPCSRTAVSCLNKYLHLGEEMEGILKHWNSIREHCITHFKSLHVSHRIPPPSFNLGLLTLNTDLGVLLDPEGNTTTDISSNGGCYSKLSSPPIFNMHPTEVLSIISLKVSIYLPSYGLCFSYMFNTGGDNNGPHIWHVGTNM